jgi:hypothetical protein
MKEFKEMQQDPSDQYAARPLDVCHTTNYHSQLSLLINCGVALSFVSLSLRKISSNGILQFEVHPKQRLKEVGDFEFLKIYLFGLAFQVLKLLLLSNVMACKLFHSRV